MSMMEVITRPFRGRAPETDTIAEVSRANRVLNAQQTLLQERLMELEIAFEGWQQMGSDSDRDFSRQGLDTIVRMARLAYLKNPLIGRAVRLQAYYVWGKGINLSAKQADINEVVQDFLDDEGNQAALTSHDAHKEREIQLQMEGNLWFVFFPNIGTGRLSVRTLPFDEMRQVITNPNDRCEPWYYRREWSPTGVDPVTGQMLSGQGQAAYYPDWRYRPSYMPFKIGDYPVHWESPVYHRKAGGLPGGLFGVPEIYAALDWARAYKESLEDDATRSRALARYAYDMTTPGGSRSVLAAQTALQTTVGNLPGTHFETNPPPVAGSTFIHSDGVEMSPVKLAGATLPVDHNRALRLMVSSATDTPDTMLSGDADVGNYATAKSLDRPTELAMTDRQTFWADTFKAILNYVVDWAALSPNGKLAGVTQVTQDEYGRQVIVFDIDPDTGKPMDRKLEVSFPSLLERDALGRVQAIVAAATGGGHPNTTLPPRLYLRQLLLALEVDDVDEVIDAIYPDADEGEWLPGADPATATADAQAVMTEAVRLLREKLAELQEVA